LGSILGSSNLTNIVEGQRQYEADCLFAGDIQAVEINNFISRLIETAARPLDALTITPVMPENNLLKDQLGVLRLKEDEVRSIKQRLEDVHFNIPLKGDVSQRSGLNASFGEGRRNKQGFVQPRSWYEVELIVPKEVTSNPEYPKANSEKAQFDVVTDDGWRFRCKVSGDYSKNFRSGDDLKTLGRWIKGRLENAGVLRPGERVSDEILAQYGRSDLKMSKIKDTNAWYLDFGVENA
ncbi:MAG: NgoFVII family restriction endonuclease, partial [Candidatus Saccharibacteria bacterium]|nr:NgoFVII family restriction endonuclease [Candidatus Saccharibacteria bacterium]